MDQRARRSGEKAEDGSPVVNMSQVQEARDNTVVTEQGKGVGDPDFTRLVGDYNQNNKEKIGKFVFHISIWLTTSSHLLQKRGKRELFPTYGE